MDNNIEKAKKLGYVETILKRKRFYITSIVVMQQ